MSQYISLTYMMISLSFDRVKTSCYIAVVTGKYWIYHVVRLINSKQSTNTN